MRSSTPATASPARCTPTTSWWSRPSKRRAWAGAEVWCATKGTKSTKGRLGYFAAMAVYLMARSAVIMGIGTCAPVDSGIEQASGDVITA